jgi:N-acetylneuraminic acid mutarotase
MFGLFDQDGWAWAFTKAFAWLLIIIMTLGYIPDRAYYFVVSRTIELGILGWSPINLCPPENGAGVPCPVPAGGIVPWQPSPQGADLPQPRSGASGAQIGKNLLVIGGTDGSAATTTTYVAQVDNGNFGSWAEGPALPEARTDAGIANLNGTAFLVGGLGPDGKATTTVWSIGPDPDTNALGTWTPIQLPDKSNLALPEARSGASVVAVSDGIVVAGGLGPDGKPTATVWKSTLDKNGVLGAFAPQPSLAYPVADADIALEGTFIWLYGGTDASGAVGGVQRASFGDASTATGSAAPGQSPAAASAGAPAASGAPAPSGAPAASPAASGAAPQGVAGWTVQDSFNLPGPRTAAAGFAANGALYLVGGSDGTSPKRELYWALPDANGDLPGGWRHLDTTDLPDALSGAAVITSGSTVFLVGGQASGGPVTSALRASLAPQEPFLQLGLVGAVVPGLQIGGQIGQQLGYLAAAGVGTGDFVLLVAIGWLFNHRETVRGWMDRRRIQREAKAPSED